MAVAIPALIAVSGGGVFPAAQAAEHTSVLAQDTMLAPGRLSDTVTDEAGAFTPAQAEALRDELKQLQVNKKIKLYVVFVPSFNGVQGSDYASSLFAANKAENVAIFAVATEGAYGVSAADSSMMAGVRQAIDDAVYPKLVDHDWFGAAEAAVKAAENPSAAASGSGGSGSGPLWLGLGALGVGGAGIGAVAYSRKNRKKASAEALDDARSIDPADVTSLKYADLDALRTLAGEEIVSTDEAIRGAEEELRLATAEFGEQRTAALSRRIAAARQMHEGYLRQLNALTQTRNASEDELRTIYADVVSHCNATDKELLSQVEEFTEMRNLLIDADSRLAALTQTHIDGLARLEQVRRTFDELSKRYDERTLVSIKDNPHLAAQHLAAAEEAIDAGRKIAARPAGQQAGLVGAIRTAENALNQADLLLSGVEHADENITEARQNLGALAREVRDEVAELAQWANTPGADKEAFHAAEAAGTKALTRFDATGDSDPLGAYTALMDADAQLDETLDAVKNRAQELSRQRQIAEQALGAAKQQVQAAEDLISTRGKVIGSQARSALAEAKERLAEAQQLYGEQNFRGAQTVARAARTAAGNALYFAQRNIDDHNEQQRHNSSGGGDGFLTGMIIGSLLDGGRSGYSGGFGGSEWSGGSFGGGFGGGGGWSGGSTSSGGAF